MKYILLLSVCTLWLYNLFRDYVNGIHLFIKKYMPNVTCDILFCQIEHEIKCNIDFDKYTHVLYFGDISYFNTLNISNIYYVNIEQMSMVSYRNMIHNINTKTKLIDYSEENIYHNKNVFQKNYIIPPYFENFFSNKTINVASIINNDYRNNIINSMHNISCHKIDNIFGQTRDNLFGSIKIYINIHGSEQHKTMELIRIVNLILNKVIVISQPSENIDLLFLKKYIIVCETPHEIETKIITILNDYDNFYATFYNDFNMLSYVNYIKSNIQKFINNT